MDFDQILPEIFVGAYPESVADIDRLKREAGITAVLNLQTDADIYRLGVDWPRLEGRYRALRIALRHVPVRDFDAEDLQAKLPECVLALSRLLEAGHTVYVHCTAGVGRSPNVVIAYLHWVQQWGLDRAIDHVDRRRPCSPNEEAIRLATDEFLLLRDSDEAGEGRP